MQCCIQKFRLGGGGGVIVIEPPKKLSDHDLETILEQKALQNIYLKYMYVLYTLYHFIVRL